MAELMIGLMLRELRTWFKDDGTGLGLTSDGELIAGIAFEDRLNELAAAAGLSDRGGDAAA